MSKREEIELISQERLAVELQPLTLNQGTAFFRTIMVPVEVELTISDETSIARENFVNFQNSLTSRALSF